MKRNKTILFYWVLFMVPTLLIAAGAYTLLSHEQERIHASAKASLVQRMQAVCDTLHITIEAVQDNLEQSLLDIDPGNIEKELIRWEKTNPLVRNAFVYHPSGRLLYPDSLVLDYERRRFVTRYESLFSGRVKFEQDQTAFSDVSGGGDLPANRFMADSKPKKRKKSVRQKLLDLSRSSKKEKAPLQSAAQAVDKEPAKYVGKKGWLPWFSENQLFILGWVQPYENNSIYGIELEWVTLLSRLVVDLPKQMEKGAVLVLRDGSGNSMHQIGRRVPLKDEKAAAMITVSPLLPHWQMALFIDEKEFGASKGFMTLSVIVLAIFLVAIISAGTLLTRITLKNMKDARQKTSFVSSVSHELKTPLTSIRMYAELLLSKRVKDENKTETYLSVIVNESQRLTRLINNVLDFARLEQGRKTYQSTPLALDQFLTEMIDIHQIRISEKNLQIRTDMPEPMGKDDYRVTTDRDALEQVFLNLLDNALKYAASGRYILFVLENDDAYINLKICDDGPGIPVAHRKMIFEKFHRADDSLTSKEPGSGLGLSIARQILHDLGGDLIFEPMPGNGSCFTARIKKDDPE